MTKTYHQALAFDFGLKQIGVATGNRQFETSQALPILKAQNGTPDWQQIEAVIQEWRPEVLLVGLPLNMDGSESEMSQRADKFARRLHGRFGLPIETVDERLSSQEAKQILREQGHKGDYLKEPADSISAQLILQTWFGLSH